MKRIILVTIILFSSFAFSTVTNIPSDYSTIQAGINAAVDGDTVLVQPGTYLENIDFSGKNIIVQSANGPGNTTINGNNSGSCVKFISGETFSAVLDGFTLTNGSGTYVNATQRFGGGIYSYNSSNPTIQNCIITGNSAGAGSGGGISCWYASATIKNCVIRNNTNHGISNSFGAGVTVINCLIRDNYGSDYGGGIKAGGGSSPTIINCTIVNNDSYHHTSTGIYAISGGTVINSIVRDNIGPDVSIIQGTTSVTYSNIEGGFTGTGNIDADPLFVNAENDDYHLSNSSPCIGAGKDTSIVHITDIIGTPRPSPEGSNPDMGAYENSLGTPLEEIIPDSPQNLTASPGNQQITLCWNANTESNLAKYRIYRSTSSPASTLIDSVVGAPPDTFYIDTGLTNGQIYYYRITAVDSAENESGYSNEVSALPHETVTDIDGNEYQIVKIGNQWWMAENLKTTHYRNGEPITKINNNTVWSNTTDGAYCNYDNIDSNADLYGSLYNWQAVDDSRNIAPEGWHVPSDEEWKELEMYLGMSQAEADQHSSWRGTDEGRKLKSTYGWNDDGNGTDDYGFTALPTGCRGGEGLYYEMGDNAYLWSSSASGSNGVWRRWLASSTSGIYRLDYNANYGFVVRCVKDSEPFDLAAYYPFNGNANDESGNGNDGTVNGATLIPDRFGNPNSAYSFNGVDNYIEIPHSQSLNLSEQISVSYWAKLKTPGPYYFPHCIIEKYGSWGSGQRDWDIAFHVEPDSNGATEAAWCTGIEPDQWVHIVGTYDGFTDEIYINGLHKDTDINPGQILQTTSNILIGTHILAEYYYFDGELDDIRIYNQALTDSQIDSLYHEGGWEQYIYVSVDSLNAIIGDTINVPVNVDLPSIKSYDSAELKFSGYKDGLEFIEVDTSTSMTGNAGWSYAVNETEDSLLVTWFAGSEDISGSGVFCWLKFVATGEPCNFTPINIESALFNTGGDLVSITNGGIYIKPIPVYGDVDSNDEIQAHDAALILKHVIEVETLDCQGLANADVTLNDTVTALDASIILQYGVGLIDSLPYDTSNGDLLAKGSITMEDGNYVPGQVVEVPLTLSGGSNILSFEGCLSYKPEQLVYSDIEWSHVMEGFLIEVNESDGKLVFAGAGSAPDGESGVFATVRFVINASFSGVETTVSLDKLRWNEGAVKYDVAISTLSRGTAIDLDVSGIPTEYFLSQNYPNPFNPVTTIQYAIPEKSHVTLTIYNIAGQALKVLENQSKEPGYYSVKWDASKVGSGVYIYEIKAGEFRSVKKCVILK